MRSFIAWTTGIPILLLSAAAAIAAAHAQVAADLRCRARRARKRLALEAQCGTLPSRKGSVAAARLGEMDPLYRLGFGIGSGLFGDPALGARGNMAKKPVRLAFATR